MDSIIEKKWFVYLGDHHEGPFTLAEVQGKMAQGGVTADNFVWAEGMKDWKPMKEVPDFASLLLPPSESPTTSPTWADAPAQIEPGFATEPNAGLNLASMGEVAVEEAPLVLQDPAFPQETSSAEAPLSTLQDMPSQITSQPLSQVSQEPVIPHLMAKSSSDEKTGDLDPSDLQKVKTLGAGNSAFQSVQTKRKFVSSGLVKGIALLLLVGGGGFAVHQGVLDSVLQNPSVQGSFKNLSSFSRPYVLKLLDKYPSLSSWISPIPTLADVSSDDYEALKLAATETPGATGPIIAMALSKADPLNPALYVASNIPDGAQFRIWVIGISDTLLNHLSFATQVDVTLNKRLGLSTPIRFPDGKPIPKGEYLIYLTPGQNQSPELQTILSTAQTISQQLANELPKDVKVYAYKTYFLGGTRDAVYTARLKEYHDKLQVKASEEIKEVSQFLNTLESQYNSSTAKFSLIKKARTNAKQRHAWEAFHTEWMKLQGQLDLIFQKWTPETVHNDYFYEPLYVMTQQVGVAVAKVHEMHHAFFSGTGDPKTFEIQIGEASSSAQTALSQLKSKIDQAVALPMSPNGMPRREGL